MARRTTAPAAKAPAREVRSRKASDAAVAQAQAAPGWGLAEAVVIVTTVLLIAAFLMTDYFLGRNFGEGLFFKS